MAKSLSITPASKHIKAYYASLRGFQHQQVAQEQAVRSAFQALLTELAKPLRWTAIPEHALKVRAQGKRTRVIPDGTLKDKYQLPRGYWEAKDSADDLAAKILHKPAKGYPFSNTIFWTPARAVLFQDGQQVHDLPIDETAANQAAFCDLLTAFFTYVDKPLVDFDAAIEEFTTRVPEVGHRLAEIIVEAHKSNKKFQQSFQAFFDLCKTTLNPNIAQPAVDEMLVQHLLTARLFKSVFNNPEFLRKNVIAAEVEKVVDALASRSFNRDDFLKSLDRFYLAIENAAERVPDWSSKQAFLNTVYERFFQGYCVKTADTHGIVYTPQPIVDFMCASVEWVLKEQFGKALGDEGVNILDPCTGTGNFIVNLMRRAADRGTKHLKRMYAEQLFANEIMLMPYYIAALNIEHEYFERTGGYEAFEGLCFVDTLDLAEPKQIGMFTQHNLFRVEREQEAQITVIVGNPPYNMGQVNENDNNKNRKYDVVDGRIRATYAKSSTGTLKTKLYDPYVRFFRWASDRIGDNDGCICFVSNNSFVHNNSFDGMRKHLARDFAAVYHIDLRGNVRENPGRSGTRYNVFGIQVGVGITVAIRRKGSRKHVVRYAAASEQDDRRAKLEWLAKCNSIPRVRWTTIRPDERHGWLGTRDTTEFQALPAISDKSARARANGAPKVLFLEYGPAINTARDATAYGFSRAQLVARIQRFRTNYNSEIDRLRRALRERSVDGATIQEWIDEFVDYGRLKWSLMLKQKLVRNREMRADARNLRAAMYRPFARRWLCYDDVLIDAPGIQQTTWPDDAHSNRCIVVGDIGSRAASPGCLMVDRHADLHLCATTDLHQCFPFYVFDHDGSNQRENITDWSLGLFRAHFTAVSAKSPATAAKARKLTKWDIFHYVYAILHHPGYRSTFAENLKRELPRIPLAATFADFRAFVAAGESLASFHLHYDNDNVVKPHKLREEWRLVDDAGRKRPKSYRVDPKMKLSKDKTTLIVNDTLTLHDIPPDVFRYRLGNRSALEWVIDQYQVYTDPKTGQVSDANAWGEEHDDPEYIVR